MLTYAKIHLCEWSPMEATLTPGSDFSVCTLDTVQGPLKVGAMICYDRHFPESARILMLKGAELILVPNASSVTPLHLAQFQVRAYENLVAVAMANYAGPEEGHSVAYDPIAFPVHEGKASWRDTLVVEAGEQEGIFLASFDLNAIRAYRTYETEGNAFRKPHRYGLLTSPEVAEPFVRVNATGEPFNHMKR